MGIAANGEIKSDMRLCHIDVQSVAKQQSNTGRTTCLLCKSTLNLIYSIFNCLSMLKFLLQAGFGFASRSAAPSGFFLKSMEAIVSYSKKVKLSA